MKNAKTYFSIGVFDMNKTSNSKVEGNCLALGRFSPESVNPHARQSGGGLAISPNNCRFDVDPIDKVSSFFTAIDMRKPTYDALESPKMPYEERAAACFHIMVHNEEDVEGKAFLGLLAQSSSIAEFLDKMKEQKDAKDSFITSLAMSKLYADILKLFESELN